MGQAIYYATVTRRKPIVILLAKDDKWGKYHNRVERCGITCFVFNVATEEWEDFR